MQRAISSKKKARVISRAAAVEGLESRVLMSTYYVANGGSDSAAGSITAPLATIQAGVNKAASGDTVIVRGGTYNITSTISINQANITVKGADGEVAKIVAPNTNSSIQVAIRVWNDADNVTLSNLDISGGYYYGIKTETLYDTGATTNANGPQHLLMSNLKVHDSGRDCIKLVPKTDYSIIENSEIYNSGRRDPSNAEGIDAVQANYSILRDSYIHDTTTNGVYYKGGDIGTVIERNRIANCAYSGILMGQSTDEASMDPSVNPQYYESIDSIVRNNIIWNCQGAGIGTWAALRPQICNNTLYNVAQTMFGGLLVQSSEHWIPSDHYVPSTDVTIYNNIVVVNGTRPAYNIRAGGLSGFLHSDYNYFWNTSGAAQVSDDVHSIYGGLSTWKAAGYDTHSLEGNPGLDTANFYHLLSTSGAIDKGMTVAGVTDDFDKQVRPAGGAYDIGADEFNGTVAQPTVPAAPSGLLASATSATAIGLTWADNANNETGYYIERSLDGTTFSQIASVGANTTSYSNTGLSASTKYYYRVRAYNTAGNSAYTTVASATTQAMPTVPVAPTGLAATASSASAIGVTWTDNATNETGYYVQRSTDGTNFTQVGSVGAGVASYGDSGLTASTTYYYRVCAYNAAGNSGYTAVANATTQAAAVVYTPTWKNTAFTAQTAKFTAEFDATPAMANEDMVMGLANGSATAVTSMAAIARFNTTGQIDARNGGAYAAAATLNYSAGSKYHFKFVVDPLAHTYDLYVTAGTTTTQIAAGYAFRTEQATTSQLNDLATYNEAGDATLTAPVVAVGVAAPAAPTGLTATAGSTSTIALAWTDNASNETGYYVQRSADGTTFTTVGTLAAGATSYGDTALSASTTYYYRVCAFNAAGSSAYTAVANATTQAATTVYTPTWRNSAFAKAQSGQFNLEFDATPAMANMDMVLGASNGSAAAVSSMAAIVRFNTTGQIDARNGAAYTAGATVNYTAGTKYHFKLVLDVEKRTYDVYVTPAGASAAVKLAAGYAFRTEQATVTQLNTFTSFNQAGDATVANVATSLVAYTWSSAPWANTAIAPQTGKFAFEVDAVAAQTNLNDYFGLSNKQMASLGDLAVAVRFNAAGVLDVRNGNKWSKSASVSYTAGATYHFRIVVDTSTHKYDVFVTAPSGTTTQIAAGFSFNSTQSTASSFNDAGLSTVNGGSLTLSNMQFLLA